ncbi:MAG: ester cyclase [Microvirga sp.]
MPSHYQPASVVAHADGAAAQAQAERIAAFFREVLATGDLARAPAYLSPDFHDHDPASGGEDGAEGVVAKLRALWDGFPDGRFGLLEVVAAGDRVAARSVFRGTQTGRFGTLAPTGRRVAVSFMDFYRMSGGMITAHWHTFDRYHLLQQLGALP